MSNVVQRVLDVARSNINVKEGVNNWNIFADKLDSISGLFSMKMQNQPWCGIFTLYCVEEAIGIDDALMVMCSPKPTGIPLCRTGANYFKSAGRWHESNPQPGDIIFFYVGGDINHTGIVEAVSGSTVTTIEGNTSDQVARRYYTIGASNSNIAGYGRPKYELVGSVAATQVTVSVPTATTLTVNKYNLRYNSRNDYVKELQEKLIKLGYSCGSYGADGDFGADTLTAVKKYQADRKLVVDGVVGQATWSQIEKDITALNNAQSRIATNKYSIRYGNTGAYVKELQEKLIKLGYSCGDAGADGDYGKDTLNALTSFQRDNSLEVDGIAGPITWNAIEKALTAKAAGTTTIIPNAAVGNNEVVIWNYLKANGLNNYAVAGIMGNFYAESVLRSDNLQDSYEKPLGMTDEQYTHAVDNGSYTNFVQDHAGYGLYQATYWSIKQHLLNYAKNHGKSIGDRDMQLEQFVSLLKESYAGVWQTLMNATSVKQASDAVLLKFERSADKSVSVQNKRAEFGQTYYNKYAK